ncbi:HalD/BesD family halogenase [Pseudomonas brassicacearum]|uniref:HalD/BesD family halogenase n=1 Tax=Pseudomonas brassicacearum TaxID=930166 RepID=UPI001D40B4BB|nr:hypothetical protein [Pseudomonas brassicacearum]CAH0131385.1 hypothetical protein SRABI06_00240 [Pseudomonas brassicacearum]
MMESLVLADVVEPTYLDKNYLQKLSIQFKQDGYLTLRNFLSKDVFSLLNDETFKLHDLSTKRDFVMAGYETPRVLSVAGGKKILKNTIFIPSLYVHHQLQTVLSLLTQNKLYTVKHQEECIVANYLDGRGQTHGWHLDDPTYALIIVLDAPAAGSGGCVEYVSKWKELCAHLAIDPYKQVDLGLNFARRHDLIKSVHLEAGDCYILNAGENLHRVTPISDNSSRRRVINMAFDHRESFAFGNTADILYAEEEIEHAFAI